MTLKSVITGTGSYIPTLVKKNSEFLDSEFLNEDGTSFGYDNEIIIEKFKTIFNKCLILFPMIRSIFIIL